MSTKRSEMNLSMLRLSDQSILTYGCELRRMRYLHNLEIRNCKLSQLGLKVLGNCLTNLKSLDLRNSDLDIERLATIISRLPKLQFFYVSENELEDDSAKLISEGLR